MKKIEFELANELDLQRNGYMLMSYDGELALGEKDRTPENTKNGELSLKGAKIFSENIYKNLEKVVDVQICQNTTGAYDVYAHTGENFK